MAASVSKPIMADRLQRIPPYPFAAIARRVREHMAAGHDVIQLDMGSPDLPPPPVVVDALCRSAADPKRHGYGGYSGTPQLRRSFAGYYQKRFGVQLDPEREVLPLIGSKEGIVNLNLALVNPGDVVLVPDPGYIAYASGALLAGAEPYLLPLTPERDFMPDLNAIPQDILKRARLMWINYPNNPTGAVATLEQMTQMVDFCRQHGIMACSDNPYADVTFDGFEAPSILQVEGAKDIAVEFNSMSKTFNMAGWRIGVCAGNAAMVEALGRVKSNIDSGLFQVTQDAACVALNDVDDEWIKSRNQIYQQRRDILMDNLDRIGLSGTPPRGSLYVWAAVKDGDDVEYVQRALDEAHVSMSAGSMYGPSGASYVRLSLVVDEPRLNEAIERLATWRSRAN